MAYATLSDLESRMTTELSTDQEAVATVLLNDAAVIIDAYNADADTSAKLIVSCRMVIRALGDTDATSMPIGATQGTMSALGYSQSWTLSNGSVGELYLSRLEKKLLGVGDSIGSYSPVEELVEDSDDD